MYTGSEATETGRAGWLAWVHAEDRARASQLWKQAQESGLTFDVECRLRSVSGEYRWFLFHIQPGDSEEGTVWCGSCVDIHEKRLRGEAQARQLEVQTEMLDASIDCIKIINRDGTLRHMNRSGCLALGVAEGESGFGMKWLELLPAEVRKRGSRALASARRGRSARFTGRSVISGEKPREWDNVLTPMRGEDNEITGILCVSREVTLEREAEKRLRMASEVDALTGLPNRRIFRARLNRMIDKSRQSGQVFGLMLFDLDYFKHVNDTMGHIAGDHLLRELSRRLASALTGGDIAVRLGGDEFAVVLGNVADAEAVQSKAEDLLSRMSRPVTYRGRPIHWGVSAGCAMFPADGGDAQLLMRCADMALNDLKTSRRGGVLMYSRSMQQAMEQAATERAVAREIVREDFVEPHYQPKVRLKDGVTVGFEALLRWRRGDESFQPASTVAEAFRDYQLATGIGQSMLGKVLRDIQEWKQQRLQVMPVSINVSPMEFLYDDFAESLLARLDEFQIEPSLIEIEITEQVLAERGSGYAVRALRMLKKAGVRIALDDFGTGYSSFKHLSEYPVDCLKIDRSFIARMAEEPGILKIVQAILQMGPHLSLEVQAEGIETGRQRAMLYRAGCSIGQGFLWGGVLTAEQVTAHLAWADEE
ncbi:GGDEF domain-containing protein [Silvibacterium dinghuense]|nr:GGDEF domain-containing protein [Silvibacterium dinghuense]